MLLYWKFLLVLGTVLWVALCLTDYICSKYTNYNTYLCESVLLEPEVVKEELNWLKSLLKQFIDLKTYISLYDANNVILIVQWISLTILCIIIFYLIGRIIYNFIANYQLRVRISAIVPAIALGPSEPEKKSIPILEVFKEFDPTLESAQKTSDLNLKYTNSKSKIPVLVTCHEIQSPIEESISMVKDTSTSLYSEEINKSCPDLSPKSSAIKNKVLFSLYNNQIKNVKSCKSVDRLRDEIVLLQETSFREQEILSRELNAIVKEKRDLSNALANSLRANKNAKRKLDEIQNERAILIKQLESATNEIKSNTKSKKLTLTRLERAIDESKDMKIEFVRLNEEKKKLEEKVLSLDRECKEMKARKSMLKKSYSEMKQDYDGNSAMHDKTDDDSLTSGGYYEVTDKQLHQSNIDMNKVQTKLNDLEKSLEKLKFSSTITKERERALQEESTDNILSEEVEISNDGDYGINSRSKFSEEDEEEDSMESQNLNYNHVETITIISGTSLDIDDCQSICLIPGCSREHNICENPVCVCDHSIQDELIPRTMHHSTGKDLDVNRVTSTNQIILEAVKEKSSILANKSSLFDTREARARLAAFFNVSVWKKKDKSTAVSSISDERLSLDSESQKTEFDYELWSPTLVAPGMVSQSPAFQKFLSNIIVDQRNAMMDQKIIRIGQ